MPAFAPVLAANGGGAIVNMLSVVSFFTNPLNASYGASKAAAWSLTNGVRIELHHQGTLVVAVHAGFINTRRRAERWISAASAIAQISRVGGEDVVAVCCQAHDGGIDGAGLAAAS